MPFKTVAELVAKYPADTVADVKIEAEGISVDRQGVSIEVAAEIFDVYMEHANPNLAKLAHDIRHGSFGFGGIYSNGYRVNCSFRRPRTKGDETHRCGSRNNDPLSDRQFPGPDTWDRIGDERVCSYCGSLHPDDLKTMIADGSARLDSCDKSYKKYVTRPSVPNAGFGGIKFYMWHAPSQEWVDEMNELLKTQRPSPNITPSGREPQLKPE